MPLWNYFFLKSDIYFHYDANDQRYYNAHISAWSLMCSLMWILKNCLVFLPNDIYIDGKHHKSGPKHQGPSQFNIYLLVSTFWSLQHRKPLIFVHRMTVMVFTSIIVGEDKASFVGLADRWLPQTWPALFLLTNRGPLHPGEKCFHPNTRVLPVTDKILQTFASFMNMHELTYVF